MSGITSIAPFDFHVHSSLSHDGSGTIEDYCQQAVARGMKAIGFCEHVDLDPRDLVYNQHDHKLYREQIVEARGRFGDQLVICMGAEVGFVPRIITEITDYLAGHHYDYVVGAVHSVFDGESGISDEYEALETFSRRELSEVYDEYFAVVKDMVRTGLFDVVGHLDLVKRFGVNHHKDEMEWGRYYGVFRRILEGVIKRQMAIEINTSGLRQDPRSTYPDPEILKLYHELDGEMVVIGSDAHEPGQLGSGIPVAIKLCRDYLLNPSISYKDRIPETINW